MSTDVAAITPPFPHLGNMLQELDSRAIAQEESGAGVVTQIMESILSADSLEDLFRAQEAGTTAGKEYVNRPFILRPENVEWRRSRQSFIDNGGFPFFFFARVSDLETGEEIVVNCGGMTVTAMMFKLTNSPAYWEQFPEGMPLMLRSNASSESDYEYLTLHPYRIPQQRTGGKK